MSNEDRLYCRLPILALSTTSNVNVGNMRRSEQLFRIYRPNTGLQQRHETSESLRKKYEKVNHQFSFNLVQSIFFCRFLPSKLKHIGKNCIIKRQHYAFISFGMCLIMRRFVLDRFSSFQTWSLSSIFSQSSTNMRSWVTFSSFLCSFRKCSGLVVINGTHFTRRKNSNDSNQNNAYS